MQVIDREIRIETDEPEELIRLMKASGLNYFTYHSDDDSVSVALTPAQQDECGGDWEDKCMQWEEDGLVFAWDWVGM